MRAQTHLQYSDNFVHDRQDPDYRHEESKKAEREDPRDVTFLSKEQEGDTRK